MIKLSNKVLSLLLALVMVLGALPTAAFALSSNNMLYCTFIDLDGNQVAGDKATYGSDKEAPEIDGYTYVNYYEYRNYIFAQDNTVYQYINGYEDSTVRADANMTRAEVAQMLYNLLETYFNAYVATVYGSFNLLEESTEGFTDVKSDAWYYEAVMTLNDMGIINGYGDGTFLPDGYITRAELAKMESSIGQFDLENATSNFSDISGHWAEAYIKAAADEGWVEGYEDGTFKPDTNITRAETMTISNRAMDRADPDNDFDNPYSDIDETHWAYKNVMGASHTYQPTTAGSTKNLVTKRYLDGDGNEIATTTTEAGDDETIVLESAIPEGLVYAGYQSTINYYYSAAVSPSIEKTANVTTVEVGDTITYTIKVSNGSDAKAAWKNVKVTDTLSNYLTFVSDSVKVDGESVSYTYEDRTLSVLVGHIAIGETKTLTFDVEIRSDAQGDTVDNTAIASGDNGAAEDSADGIAVPVSDTPLPSEIFVMLMNGYEDGQFRPSQEMSREEAVVLLYRILAIATEGKYNATDDAANTFSDIESDRWSYEAIDFMLTNGYISSTSEFRPFDAITRAEYCSMFNKALELEDATITGLYTDISGHWGEQAIYNVLAKGWITATEPTFNPDGAITREVAAKMIAEAQEGRMALYAQVKGNDSYLPYYGDVRSGYPYYDYIMAVYVTADYTADGKVA